MSKNLLFHPPEPVTVPIIGGDGADRDFPVRHVFCVGRNYADHAREMGHDPTRDAPFFFTKGRHAVISSPIGRIDVPFPPATDDLHHEVELVVALGADAQPFGYAVGIDFTRRDLQAVAKEKSRPWDMAKSFTNAAPVGPITPLVDCGELTEAAITLSVNGDPRQRGNLNQMIWNIEEIIEHLNRFDTLAPGDLIFTGTPAGVGRVTQGDTLTATIDGLHPLEVTLGG